MHEIDQNTLTVDARGLNCPEPLVLTRRALNTASAGTLLHILATDPLASLDIEALCARGACAYLGCTTATELEYLISIRAL